VKEIVDYMRKALPLFLIIVLAFAGLGIIFARNAASPPGPRDLPHSSTSTAAPNQTEITVPTVENNEFKLTPRKVELTPGGDPVAKTLEALMAAGDEKNSDSAIPAGTRLVSVKVKRGQATLDLSDDFNMLNKKGDTTQSLAQQQIRAALAQFPEIKKMRVTVDGKTFEDGHSGPWDDIPVRGEAAGSGGGNE
jgi:spore germination protein GerM